MGKRKGRRVGVRNETTFARPPTTTTDDRRHRADILHRPRRGADDRQTATRHRRRPDSAPSSKRMPSFFSPPPPPASCGEFGHGHLRAVSLYSPRGGEQPHPMRCRTSRQVHDRHTPPPIPPSRAAPIARCTCNTLLSIHPSIPSHPTGRRTRTTPPHSLTRLRFSAYCNSVSIATS